MVFLITGGAGFIGSHFADYLLSAYPADEVVCLDALTYAANVASLRSALANRRFHLIQADITDGAAVERAFAAYRPEIVVNLAAESHVDRSIEDPALFVRTNVDGTAILLDACHRHAVRRFHQVSTDEVYGDLPIDSTLRFDESAPLRPSSPYAASKAAADLLALSYHRTFGMAVTVSRCTNNYGPRQFPEKLIPLTVVRASANQSIPLYGDGRNVRDWIAVADHCRALDVILRRGVAGEIYNVGADAPVDNKTMVRAILRLLDKPEILVTRVADRPGHDRRYALDSAKLRALGWTPDTAFSDGLAATVQWYIDNTDWWRDIQSGAYRRYRWQ